MGEILKNSKTSIKKGCALNDSDILNDVLISYKHLVSCYATALNEASNKNIYKLFFNAFESSSKIQAELFDCSFKKGWYNIETADEEKIEKAYNKYNSCVNELYSDESSS